MNNDLFRKGLVYAIVVLFIGVSIIPSTGSKIVEKSSMSPDDVVQEAEDVILPIEVSSVQKEVIMDNFGFGPLFFTENKGQFPEEVLFQTHVSGATVYLCRDGVVSVFSKVIEEESDEEHELDTMDLEDSKPLEMERLSIKAEFVDANMDTAIVGKDVLSHYNNYFIGNNPDEWYTNVPNYKSVWYKDIYPGIDLHYYGDGDSLKYDFIVYPEADPSVINIRYDGVEDVKLTSTGDLQMETLFGSVYEKTPLLYQEIDGIKKEITGQYELREPDVFGFAIDGDYNSMHPLIIDPELVYSTYLGGTNGDLGYGIAVDNNGCAYITGYTESSGFPTVNAYDDSFNGSRDCFVTKFNVSGNSLVYSTYLGGVGRESGGNIAVDDNGCVYITGYTESSDFPMMNAYDDSLGGSCDCFVTKFSNSGDSLIYSTYLGGVNNDYVGELAVDNNECAYVTGYTRSPDYPTVNAYDDSHNGDWDCFVTKFSNSGDSLIYSTFIGASGVDEAYGIAVDNNGCAYITGWTQSSNYPTVNAFDDSHNGGGYHKDGFVTKLSASGDSLEYSTFLGGTQDEAIYDIAVNSNGNAYVTGRTYSYNFPRVNSYDSSFNGYYDCFVTKFSNSGDSLIYSTYLGGGSGDLGREITVDDNGCAYVTGYTWSSDFPTVNAFDDSYNGGFDCFVTKISTLGNSLIYSTYFGGAGEDGAYGIAVDNNGCTYITGYTESSGFPTVNAYDDSYNGGDDCFVTNFFSDDENLPPAAPSNPNPYDGETDVYVDIDLSWTCEDPNGGPITYDIYLGTTSPPPKIVSNQSGKTYYPENLEYVTQYYWQIVAWDNYNATVTGPIWSFTTEIREPPNVPSDPNPSDGATNVSIDTTLSWTGGDPNPYDIVTYDIYFGITNLPPKLVSNHSKTTYNPGILNVSTTYYWKIVAWDNHGDSTVGPIWTFTTLNNPLYIPTNPNPNDGETDVDRNADLSWTGGGLPGTIVTYDVYFGTSNPPSQVVWNQSETSYDPGTLNRITHYYWQIIAWDDQGNFTSGPIWDFTTKNEGTIISIQPSTTTVKPGETFDVSIYVDPSDLLIMGIEFNPLDGGLWFDPALLQANSVTKDYFFYPYYTTFNSGDIDNVNGEITGLGEMIFPPIPGQGVNTPGSWVTIEFTAQQELGTSSLNLGRFHVVDADSGIVYYVIGNDGMVYMEEEHEIAVINLDVPEYIFHNEVVNVEATIVNDGIHNESNVLVNFTVDGSVENSTVINSLNVGQSELVSFEWMPDIGTYVVGIEAQPVPGENVTSNNALYSTVHIEPVVDIWVDPTEFTFILNEGVTVVDILTIGNEPFAEGALEFDISYEGVGGSGWLSVNPTEGSVEAGNQMDLDVVVNTTGLDVGLYTAFIVVSSNDLNDPFVYISVNLSIVFEDDVGAVSINYPTGVIPPETYVVNATVENFGVMDKVDVLVNCSIFKLNSYEEDFEANNGSYSSSGTNLWEWGTPTFGPVSAYSGTNCWGTNLDGDYPDNANAWLDSIPIYLPADLPAELSFCHYHDMSDMGRVKISTDGGSNWHNLGTYYGRDGYWKEATFNLSAYAGEIIIIRWQFTSDWIMTFPGWYIDYVTISPIVSRTPEDTIYSSEETVSIPAFSTAYVEFITPWDAPLGTFEVIVTTMLPGDQNPNNDHKSITTTVIEHIPPEITNVTDLSDGWNLISVPFNQSVNKTDLIVRYNDSYYSWQEAVADSIILDSIYGWDRSSQIYELTDTLTPGLGYWMYAYHDCEILAKGVSNFVTDDFITDLLPRWNIVGLPYNKSLYKYSIIIRYNGTDYSWYDATTGNNEEGEPLILGFIYGWDTDNQRYILSDVFTPKHGYWMYAYYNCSLKRNV